MSATPEGAFRLDARPVHPALRGLVRGLWDYEERHPGLLRRREMPVADAVLLFNLGPPIGVAWPDPAGETRIGEVAGFLATPHPAPAFTSMAHRQAGVQVMLTPLGAERLLRSSLGEASGLLLPLRDALGPDGVSLGGQLADAPGAAERLDHVEAWLLRHLAAEPPPSDPVAAAWSLLEASGGRVDIGKLARSVGWSRQTLSARFRARTGFSPKVAARLMRFGGVVARLDAAASEGWAGLAAEAGFADQSHLIREVRALTGLTPGELLARRLPGGAGFAL